MHFAKFNARRFGILSRGLHGSRAVSDASVDQRVGTVAAHRHHLVVCNSEPDEWPARVEGLSETISALSRGSTRLPSRAMVTVSDFAPIRRCHKSSLDRIDVAVFPLGLVARDLDKDGVQSLLSLLSRPTLPTSWSPTSLPFDHSWLELSHNRHIFVCTHGSRDPLCGLHGGRLLKELRAVIEARRLGKHVAAWATSHIGGHKFAANAIVYPRGDWYATWCERCKGESGTPVADAETIVDAALRDSVWWDAWRGAINMTKEDQIDTWLRHSGHECQSHKAEDAFETWIPPATGVRGTGIH
ncbi:hypothetical protein GGH91_000101 [Coemansia sp. RSA 2671]|nr:hypothetical protein LPJ60_000205 [Coemansia sp. RSA 2675]KAJ2350507.1 hypothetical protein GGH91_000101 [Coemansia sp. RSA 2671]